MPGPHPTNQPSDRPTAKQMRYLRALANSRDQTFRYPLTKAQASQEIKRLLRQTADSQRDRSIERHRLQRDLEPHGDATQIREDELAGYGANARWNRKDNS
jgi:hypothetical protein